MKDKGINTERTLASFGLPGGVGYMHVCNSYHFEELVCP